MFHVFCSDILLNAGLYLNKNSKKDNTLEIKETLIINVLFIPFCISIGSSHENWLNVELIEYFH